MVSRIGAAARGGGRRYRARRQPVRRRALLEPPRRWGARSPGRRPPGPAGAQLTPGVRLGGSALERGAGRRDPRSPSRICRARRRRRAGGARSEPKSTPGHDRHARGLQQERGHVVEPRGACREAPAEEPRDVREGVEGARRHGAPQPGIAVQDRRRSRAAAGRTPRPSSRPRPGGRPAPRPPPTVRSRPDSTCTAPEVAHRPDDLPGALAAKPIATPSSRRPSSRCGRGASAPSPPARVPRSPRAPALVGQRLVALVRDDPEPALHARGPPPPPGRPGVDGAGGVVGAVEDQAAWSGA